MGAYLYFKLKDKRQAEKAMNWLENESVANKKLMEINEGLFIVCPSEIQWAIDNNNPSYEDECRRNLGRGSIKTSGGRDFENDLELVDMLEMWVEAFEELNEKFEMQYLASSCAFTVSEDYFSVEQMKRMTRNGTLLSDKRSEKYQGLLNVLTAVPTQDEKIEAEKNGEEIKETVLTPSIIEKQLEALGEVKNHKVMKMILKDSMGGIMYNESNRDKYDTEELLELWNTLDDSIKETAGGIINGAINFIKDYSKNELPYPQITAKNIAELYPTMSDEEKRESVHLIRSLIKDREEKVTDAIREETKILNLAHYESPIIIRDFANLSKQQEQELRDRGDGNIYGGDRYVGQTIFGVKDNLQPIEEFIQEIKNSTFYKFFIETVVNKSESKYIQTDKAFHDFSAKFKNLKDIENAITSKQDKAYGEKIEAIGEQKGQSINEKSKTSEQVEAQQVEEKSVVKEPQLKLTPYLRTTENGEELHQIKALQNMNINGEFIPKGCYGGWISSLDNVGENTWFTKNVEVWQGVELEPNTYLDAVVKIKDNSDISVAQAMTRNGKKRGKAQETDGNNNIQMKA